MKDAIKALLTVAAVLGFIAAIVGFDFYVWRSQHPQAPAWTFLFR